ncbi:winged helix-turn-helix domain-containing protein [Serratia rhizosphaerae]|uniref:Winged helix-turn-helix domain-containing protein n=1 Tax=Serratia rhizosphaerae TaxID=2597702 RepID=A0ABX6GHX0_9GAMM|nr:winged helix-turn-helix domain-containing protein [Serratia rhizosphaerae]QHA85844.1 winged helix-turn-helix domain-containing protein [Serratia rhizosphaerae]
MSVPVISLAAARALHLAAQGLLTPAKRKAGPEDVVAAIQRMGLLQIDTISVVARSPYLVLFSRLGDYAPQWLEQALAGRQLFEYWAHEACFLPIEDFALLRHRMLNPQGMGWKYSQEWAEKHQDAINDVLSHIAANGPLRSADFNAEKKGGNGWWEWKPEKRHLETLFTAGKLMVAERRNFHRVYDLTERLLPDWDDARQALSEEEARRVMLARTCRYLGIFKAEWLADYYRLKRVAPKKLLQQLQLQGEILPIKVAQLSGDFYLHHSLAEALPLAEQNKLRSRVTTLLSPFDPVVWDRRRALELFNFDYRLECYTPKGKRQYGYFTLPVLNRGELIGRIDAKMHRRAGEFEVISFHLETGVRMGKQRCQDLFQGISRMAKWHGAGRVRLRAVPGALREQYGEIWQVG